MADRNPGYNLRGTMAGATNYGGFVGMQGMHQYVQPAMPPYPMMQQGMVPGAGMRPPVFPMQVPVGPRGMNPPPYTPQLAHNFQAKQRLQPVDQKHVQKKETCQKEMDFLQQKQRLKDFNNRMPVDAHKMIESMFGKTEKAKDEPETADPFGDFMQGPSAPAKLPDSEISLSDKQMASQQPTTPVHMAASSESDKMANNNTAEPKHDLLAKMLECSDLTVGKKAKTFQRPSLNEIQTSHSRTTPVFHESGRARHWSGTADENDLSDFFQAEAKRLEKANETQSAAHHTKHKPAPLIMPAWCKSEDRVPALYRQVLEASIVDGKIATERLYPILLLSGLQRELLGRIWSMANQLTPGQLTKPELFLLLGYIALAQNNVSLVSIEMLMRCPHPPVPFLGQEELVTPSQAPPNGHVGGIPVPQPPHGNMQAAIITVPTPQLQQPPMPVQQNLQGPPRTEENLPNFQEKPNSDESVVTNRGIPVSFKKPGYIIAVPKPDDAKLAAELSPDMTYSNVRNFFGSDDSSGTTDDDFDDFKSADSKHSDSTSQMSTSEQSENEDFKSFENYLDDFGNKKEEIDKHAATLHKPRRKFTAAIPSKVSPLTQPVAEIPKIPIPSIPAIAAFPMPPAKLPEPSMPAIKAVPMPPAKISKPSMPVIPAFPLPPAKMEEFGDFAEFRSTGLPKTQKELNKSSTEPDFADFQSAFSQTLSQSASSSNLSNQADKYAAFRSLTSENDLMDIGAFTKVTSDAISDANTSLDATEIADVNDDENWANFQSAFSLENPEESTVSSSNDAVEEKSKILSLYKNSAIINEPETSETNGNWSDFGNPNQECSEPALFSDTAVKMEESSDWSDFSSAANRNDMVPKEHSGKSPLHSLSSEQNIEPAADTNEDWADFQVSEPKKSNIVFVKKENIEKNEILNLFKIKDETSFIPDISKDKKVLEPITSYKESASNRSLPQTEQKRQNLSSTSVDVDDDSSRAPPPMDDFCEEEDDFGAFSRGYELDENIAHPPWEHHKKNLYGVYRTNRAVSESSTGEDGNIKLESENVRAQESTACDTMSTKALSNISEKIKDSSKEDTQSISSLELPDNTKGLIHTLAEQGDTQSVSSAEFGNFEVGKHYTENPESKSLESLDLRKVDDGAISESVSLDSLDLKNGEDAEMSEELDDVNLPSQNPETKISLIESASTSVSSQEVAPVPFMGDRYSEILHDIPGSDKHAFEWERCLDNCYRMIRDANNIFNSVSSSAICGELTRSIQGAEYVQGIIEIYRVTCRITVSLSVLALGNEKLQKLLKDIDLAWNNLTAFLVGCSVLPDSSLLDFSHAVLKSDDAHSQYKACGVCLLSTDCASKSFSPDENRGKLTYGGRQYHAPCANFWINCVDSTLPALKLPELL